MTTATITENPKLRLARHYTVAPEKVWRAWTDPKQVARWFYPSGQHEVVLAEADVRVGGSYRITLRGPAGKEDGAGGVYREVTPQRKLVFTWRGECGGDAESLVTLSFTAAGGGTDFVLLHERFADVPTRDMHEAGWNGCLASLGDYLSGA
jgi:uncharacterized protein YndB with AHSA1/START domain